MRQSILVRQLLARLLILVVFSLASCGVAAPATTAAGVARRPGWATLSAVKDHRVSPIDDAFVSRPGPRLADGLAAIAKLLHPELYP